MRTPGFWYRPSGAAAWTLAPLGTLYGAAGRLRAALARPYRAAVPVICVGNLVAGGAGKTPVALSVAGVLQRRGHRPHFLTRGHGGSSRGPLRVDPERHDAATVGDEALLLAAAAPAWVARDRAAGARAAAADGATVIILDDGFQNPTLVKDLSLVVVDGAVGFGNGRLIPAGPLREPAGRGLARADAVIVLGSDRAGVAAQVGPSRPVLQARLEATGDAARSLRGQRVLAFAGIGRPDKFFVTCGELGSVIVDRFAFADHHPYQPGEILALVERANALQARLVTTAKDAVRLPPALRAMVHVVPVTVTWADPAALERRLAPMLEDPTVLESHGR